MGRNSENLRELPDIQKPLLLLITSRLTWTNLNHRLTT